jgi:hypothetical protein
MSNPQIDKTALSYWFPKIEAAGVPVPKTTLVHMPKEAHMCVAQGLWGETPTPECAAAYSDFIAKLSEAVLATGLPCFLRTDHTSNKHSWDKACYVTDIEKLKHHVFEIAEFSECCDLIGLPYSVWAVREFLPTKPHGTCPRYGNMPVCREFRFFVDDGVVRCAHPYWPRHALEDGDWTGSDSDFDLLCARPHELTDLAIAAGKAVGGSWSIDVLETKRGWYVTDMAEAHKSFHWEGCKLARKAA